MSSALTSWIRYRCNGVSLIVPSVGKLVVAALAHPDVSMGKILKVQSFVTTANEILAEFEKQTGSKFDVQYTPKDKLRELELKLWAEGNPVATGFTLRRIWADGRTLYAKTDNESLGLQQKDMETLSAVVKRAVDGDAY